jgi:hypothetical protein
MTQTLANYGLAEVATGVMPGLDQDKVPLWSQAINVLCDQYGVRPSPGYGTFGITNTLFDDTSGNFDDAPGLFDAMTTGAEVVVNVGEEIRGLLQVRMLSGQRRIYYGTLTRLFSNAGFEEDLTNGSGYDGYADEDSGNPATYWSMAAWGDWVLATNGFDPPQIYKNTGNFINLPNAQCTWAQLVFTLGPHVILANTSNGQNVIEWSAQDNPEQWDFTTHVTAGRRVIRTFEGPIVAAVPLGRAYMLYGENQAHVMQYGGQFVFSTVPGPKGCGAVSKNSVVAVGNMNYGLMPEGIFATDGVQVQWITYPQLGRWLMDNVEWSQKSKIAGWYDPEARCIRWAIPMKGDPTKRPSLVLVCNLAANGALTFESTPFLVGSGRGGLGYNLVGTIDGKVLAQRWDVSKPSRVLETKYIDFGNKDRRKYLDALRIMAEGSDFRVSIGFADHVQQVPDWYFLGTTADLTENTFYFSRDTVYAKIRIECNDVNANWRLSGMSILGRLTARRY